MDYISKLKSVFLAGAEQRFYSAIPNKQVLPVIADDKFIPNECYLRIWLSDMYLAHKRVLYKTRSPVVHTICRFNYAGTPKDLRLIVGPGQSEELGGALDRMVNLNYPLLGPIPYDGSDVELLITLMAMEVNDYGNELLNVLGVLSQLTGKGELTTVLPVLSPLKQGIEGLLGIQGHRVHLGIHDTFAGSGPGNNLIAGYKVVLDISGERIDPEKLWVKNGRLYWGTDLQSAVPYNKTDYFMFYLEKVDQRNDIIPTFTKAWNETIEKTTTSNEEEIDFAFNTFQSLVLTSPDLIWNDKISFISALVDKIKILSTLKERRGFVPHDVETTLEGSLVEQQEFYSQSGIKRKPLSREELIRLSWH